jgi:hypothetical protein
MLSMLRTLTITAALVTVLGSCASAQVEGTIFREIDLGAHGHLRLGEPFSQREEIGVPVGERQYRLRPGTFGGAEAIIVSLAEDGRVCSLRFEYVPDRAEYERYVQNGSRSMGKPSMQATSDEEGRPTERTRWEDSRTTFEVVWRQGQSGPELFSVLSDRACAARTSSSPA